MSAPDLDLKGSCLCGAISYHITGKGKMFNHCHCQRCRKATGTGHASNLIFKFDSAEWLSGEELLKSYKVPEAERYITVFCSNCGSSMPRINREQGFVVLPAGTLDNEPQMQPLARIFQDSRAEWSCQGDDVACFETYPPR